jgi:hypothetical protein
MVQPQIRHRKRRFKLDESRAVSSTPGAEPASDETCQMLKRDLIETWDKTKRGELGGEKDLSEWHVQFSNLLFPQGSSNTRFLRVGGQCKCDDLGGRADVSCLLPWQLPSHLSRLGLAGRTFSCFGMEPSILS